MRIKIIDNIEEYFPLPEKAKWEYSVEMSSPFGGIQKGKRLVRIDGEELINGKIYNKTVSVFSGFPGAEPEIIYLRKEKDGFYAISNKYKDEPEYLTLPLPLFVGRRWTVESPEGFSRSHLSSVEVAELFDRKYEDCIKISYKGKYNNKNYEGFSYHARNVGMVWEIDDFEGTKIEMNLTSYDKQ